MSDLVAFLAARLKENEERAWAVHDVAKCDALLYEEDMAAAAERDPDCNCGQPARTRRDVAAKRAILAEHEPRAVGRSSSGTVALRARSRRRRQRLVDDVALH